MKRSIITTIAVLLLIVFYSCNNAKIDNSANLERMLINYFKKIV